MINWVLKLNTNKLVCIFYLPWVLFLLIPLTSFYGDATKIFFVLTFVIWLQISIYMLSTFLIFRKMLELKNNEFYNVDLTKYKSFTYLSFLIVSFLVFFIIFNRKSDYYVSLFFVYLIIEFFRMMIFSKLLVTLELKKKVKLSEYFLTSYLLISPHIGIWNLHKRLKAIFNHNSFWHFYCYTFDS